MTDLELLLRQTPVEWPATPDLAGTVRERIEAEPVRHRRRLTWRRALAALLVVVAGAFAIEPARAKILDWLGIGGAKIERREPTATPRPVPPGASLGAGLDLGEPVTAGDAARRADFTPAPPSALGPPDAVFYADAPPEGGRVSYVYRAGKGLPRGAETGAGLLVTQMLAQTSQFIEKAAGPGTVIERFRLDGEPAIRLSGAPHGFAYAGRDGEPVFENQRLAGPTLLVERADGILLRIEGRVSKARAIRIARSIDAGP